MAKITVIAAVLDRGILSLYQPDGSTYVIEQGDSRLEAIVRQCAENQALLSSGQTIEVDVGGDDPTYNAYKEYEAMSNGLVLLFKIAKEALASFLSQKPKLPEQMAFGTIPPVMPVSAIGDSSLATVTVTRSEPLPEASKLSDAISQILAGATPVSHETFTDKNVGDKGDGTHTIIAVVGDQVIGGMENLKTQMAHASQTSAVGFNRFMERMAAVAAKRRHSVDDLLKFMQKGDLPIADDGSIVIYKALRRRNDHFVDIHSGNVTQKVGSYVHMDESLVDHDRSRDCSNGLHVARRQYLRGFTGDVCVIAKVAPEDVIAVPEYDANKMRVCGYHILFELSREAYNLLLANQPLTSIEADAKLLGRALSGDHDEPIEDVKITGHYGAGLVITPRTKPVAEQVADVVETELQKQERIGVALETEEQEDGKRPLTAAHVDAKAIAKQVNATKTLSRAEKAQALFKTYDEAALDSKEEKEAAQALMTFKQTAKVSWEKLGLEDLTDELKEILD